MGYRMWIMHRPFLLPSWRWPGILGLSLCTPTLHWLFTVHSFIQQILKEHFPYPGTVERDKMANKTEVCSPITQFIDLLESQSMTLFITVKCNGYHARRSSEPYGDIQQVVEPLRGIWRGSLEKLIFQSVLDRRLCLLREGGAGKGGHRRSVL